MTASKSTRRVVEALEAHGIDAKVHDMPNSTRTATDAAAAVGCSVGQIVKSLLFATDDGGACLVLASGPNRVDPEAVTAHLGRPVRMADAAKVRVVTGFAIGGVAPVGLASEVPVLMDEDLLAFEVIWAAAGTPKSVFPIAPSALLAATGATVLSIRGAA